MPETIAVIDVGVTVLGEVSHFWDIAGTVSSMLIAEFASSPLRIADHETVERSQTADLAKVSAPLNSTLTGELDGAQWYLGLASRGDPPRGPRPRDRANDRRGCCRR